MSSFLSAHPVQSTYIVDKATSSCLVDVAAKQVAEAEDGVSSRTADCTTSGCTGRTYLKGTPISGTRKQENGCQLAGGEGRLSTTAAHAGWTWGRLAEDRLRRRLVVGW
tara:strand:+ start:962 stop:1288 length:327 start_codon:yes stop_codon:yes gene_type:complete